jgi:hypothetical protein
MSIWLVVSAQAVAAEARDSDFQVASACAAVARGFVQMATVVQQSVRVVEAEDWKHDAVAENYKKIKAEMVTLDWTFRVVAGPRAYGIIYENEDEGGGMVRIAIGMVDDIILERSNPSMSSDNIKLVTELLSLRSQQLIEACRHDFQGN